MSVFLIFAGVAAAQGAENGSDGADVEKTLEDKLEKVDKRIAEAVSSVIYMKYPIHEGRPLSRSTDPTGLTGLTGLTGTTGSTDENIALKEDIDLGVASIIKYREKQLQDQDFNGLAFGQIVSTEMTLFLRLGTS